jgi:hypothetical protein
MAAPRRVVELSIDPDDLSRLELIARSRTEPAIRVERLRILLAYQSNPSSVASGPTGKPGLGCGSAQSGQGRRGCLRRFDLAMTCRRSAV